MIGRPRLTDRLDRGAPVTVLQAPAGYGKTVLMQQWLDAKPPGRSTVWITAHPVSGSNEMPADVLWSELAHAVRDAGLVPSSRVRPASGRRAGVDPVATVRDALAGAAGPVTVVVDDADHLPRDAGPILAGLREANPRLRLICALRGTPPPAEIAAQGVGVAVISGSDLLLTPEESVRLFARLGVRPAAALVARAHSELGGWPVAMRSVAAAAAHLGGGHSLRAGIAVIAQTRVAELVSHLDPDRRRRLFTFALVDEITPELADLVGGRDAAVLLDQLQRDGLVFPGVDGDTSGLRLAGAVREALAVHFERDAPADARAALIALSRHLADSARPELALTHAVRAADWPRAVELVEGAWGPILAGHPHALQRALTAIPLSLLRTSNTAMAVRSVLLDMPDGERHSLACSLPESKPDLVALGRSTHAATTIEEGLAVMVAHRLRRDVYDACTIADRLELVLSSALAASTPSALGWVPGVHLQIGITRLLTGRAAAAVVDLRRAYGAVPHAPQADARHVEVDAAAKLALAHALIGEVPQAEHWLETHPASAATDAWYAPMVASSAHLARVLIGVDRLDLAAATAAMRELGRAGTDGARVRAYPDHEPWLYLQLIALARYALVCDDPAAALRRIDRVPAPRDEPQPDMPVEFALLAARAELLLALGHGDRAHGLLGPAGSHPVLAVPRARLALLTGQAAVATEIVGTALLASSLDARDHLQLQVLHAIARERLGQAATAERVLRSAARRATATGCIYAFATVPRNELVTVAARVPEAARLLASAPLADLPDVFPPTVTMVELTAREREILSLVAGGMSGPQITAQLFVSQNTWKFHSRNLYRKLGATSRPEALSRARLLGLIPPEAPAPDRVH